MSDFLFAQPSFLSGMATVLDIGATFATYNESRTPELADSRAVYNDWRAVGNDLFSAAMKFKAEHERAAERVS